jgi:hypothetical protein
MHIAVTSGSKTRQVSRALRNTFGPFDCPSGMVSAKETVWYVDTPAIAEFKKY